MSRHAILQLTIWLATAVCVAMLFMPLVHELLLRLGPAVDPLGAQ